MRDNGKYVNKKGYIVKHQNHIFRTAITILIFTSIVSIIIAVVLALFAGSWVLSKPDILFGKISDASGSVPDNTMDWLSVVLSYIGAIIGGMASGIVAIVGVYWTINYERNKDKEEKRIDIMPMFAPEAEFYGPGEEDKDIKWGGGCVRLPFGVDYDLIEETMDTWRGVKDGILQDLEDTKDKAMENESEKNSDKSDELQKMYKAARAKIEDCDDTTAEGLAELLCKGLVLDKELMNSKEKKKIELMIDSLNQMEELGYHELMPQQVEKDFFHFHKNKRLYVKSQSKEKRKWVRKLSKLEYDKDSDMCMTVSLQNSGGVGYLQEVISEDGQVWDCDYTISSKGKRNWFYIITEKNIFSKVSFWIKYKDALNNSYYQKFTMHPWYHIPDYMDVLASEKLETEAPYLEV